MLAERLSALREARGLTQYRLSKLSGVTTSWINKIEAGKAKRPGQAIVDALARALGVTSSQLSGTEGPAGEGDNAASGREVGTLDEKADRDAAIRFLSLTTDKLTAKQIRELAEIGRVIRQRETENYDAYMRAKPPEQHTPRKPQRDDNEQPPPQQPE